MSGACRACDDGLCLSPASENYKCEESEESDPQSEEEV